MKIRAAQTKDAEAIHRLIANFVPEFQASPDGEGLEQYFEIISVSAIMGYVVDDTFEYIVAMEGERLVAVAALRDGSHLYHFFVEAEFHRRGIGRKLWEELRRRSPRDHYTLNATPNAIAAYQRLGFKICGEPCSAMGIRYTPMEWSGRRR